MSNVYCRTFFFAFFLVSGFCGLLDEIIWTRLAMAHFGVTTAVVSVVLSVFMAGLALGSWLAGHRRLLAWLGSGRRFLRAYAAVELGIGVGALVVPLLFGLERALLLRLGESSSLNYHALSAICIGVALLPWTTLMGATFAMAMGALRTISPDGALEKGSARRAFSYLYLANVLGAACGTILTAVALVELYGFRGTLRIAALANATISACAWLLARAPAFEQQVRSDDRDHTADIHAPVEGSSAMLAVLFATGLASMAMEVVWARMFSHYLGTFVYSFAALLAVYLMATYVGAHVYRWRAALGLSTHAEFVWATLGLLSILPLIYADRRFIPHRSAVLVLVVAPFCAALGYVTPLLIDRYAGSNVGRASRAYALNVLGCIVGPLAAGYLLLPWLGERTALITLAVVPAAIGAWATANMLRRRAAQRYLVSAVFGCSLFLAYALATSIKTYMEAFPGAVVRRDHTATVVAYGEGMKKLLLVNGVGITELTTITKTMAHFPLAHLTRPPRSALVICFGMGTTFRSLASWGIETTAVDLVPSVPALFGYFYSDAPRVLSAPNVHVVIDDGRRFLDRTRQEFDLITLDPPPPIQAAGSSLLYSREFYQAAKRRLRHGGIVAQWMPRNDRTLVSPIVRALLAEFPYVRAFGSIEGQGVHFLASEEPIPMRSSAELAMRLAAGPQADLIEWMPIASPQQIFQRMLSREVPVLEMTQSSVRVPVLTDDHPSNEYFALRRLRHHVP